MVVQDYEEYYQFAQMVEKMVAFHQNSFADNMVFVEVAHKTVENMDYNVEATESEVHIAAGDVHIVDNMNYNFEAVESRVHIAVKAAYKTVKIAANN